MRFAQTEPDASLPRGTGKVVTTTLRLATAAYWALGLMLGLAHVRAAGFTDEAWGATLTVWYAEALIFLAVFGGGAFLSGVFTRHAASPRRAKPLDPLKTSTLAGVERNRGH